MGLGDLDLKKMGVFSRDQLPGGRKKDQRRGRLLANRSGQGEAIHFGHLEVNQNNAIFCNASAPLKEEAGVIPQFFN